MKKEEKEKRQVAISKKRSQYCKTNVSYTAKTKVFEYSPIFSKQLYL